MGTPFSGGKLTPLARHRFNEALASILLRRFIGLALFTNTLWLACITKAPWQGTLPYAIGQVPEVPTAKSMWIPLFTATKVLGLLSPESL